MAFPLDAFMTVLLHLQISTMGEVIYGHAVKIAAVGAEIDLILPDLVTVNSGVDIPGNGMGIVDIDAAEVFQLHKGLEDGALFQKRMHVVKPDFAVVEADGQGKIVICNNGSDCLSST